MDGIQFAYDNTIAIPLALLILVVSGVLAWWMYRRTKDTLPRIPRMILGIFRFLVFAIVGLLFLDPQLEKEEKISTPPVIAVLHDNSESLVIHKDSAFMHTEYPAMLKNFMQKLEDSDVSTEFFSFSQAINKSASPDSLSYDQSGTNISGALRSVYRQFSGQNLGAVVLISDGISTSGENPGYVVEEFRQPVFSVLLGDTTPQKDVKIAEVLHNQIAYLDNETPVKVKVYSTGYENQELTVTISHKGKLLGSKKVTVTKNVPNVDVDFLIKPDAVGLQQYSLGVTTLPDEISKRNNYKAIFINVLETKVKIALFGGYPHPDIGALRQAFNLDERYSVTEFIHKSPQEYYTNPADYPLTDYDLVILHNWPFSSADAPMVDKIKEQVKNRNLPLMVFVGQSTNLTALKGLDDYLGLTFGAAVDQVEEAEWNFKEDYENHSTYTFDESWRRLMNEAPPLFRNRSDWKAKGDTRVFATARIKNVALDYPIYALQNHLNRKNMMVIGENIWRTRAYSFVETNEFTAFDDWLYNNIQWLMVQEDKRKFKVRPSKPLFTGSEAILFRGEAYDDNYNPLGGVDVKVNLKDANGKEDVYYMSETSSGQYFLELNNLEEGTYTYTAEGTKNGARIGTDNGQFSVGKSNIEHFNLTANRGMMEQLSLRTEGKFAFARDIESLTNDILSLDTLKPVVRYNTRRKGLNHYEWIFYLLLGLLAVEWVVRKRFSLV